MSEIHYSQNVTEDRPEPPGAGEHADFGGYQLGKDFSELPEFDEAGVRIVGEIPFRLRAQPDELLLTYRHEPEIGRCRYGSRRPGDLCPLQISHQRGNYVQDRRSPSRYPSWV